MKDFTVKFDEVNRKLDLHNLSYGSLQGFMERVADLVGRITASCLGKGFKINLYLDKVTQGRVYIQISYKSFNTCVKEETETEWFGRKWYLSEHMTDDEVIKTCYLAFEVAVKHEVLEGFKVDGKSVFNPHTNFEALLSVSKHQVKRDGHG